MSYQVCRGLILSFADDQYGAPMDIARKIVDGTVTAADILRGVHSFEGHAGNWWGPNDGYNWSLDESKAYAHAEEYVFDYIDDFVDGIGGEIGVVLVGTSPEDPSTSKGGYDGGYYLSDGTRVSITEVHYDAGHGWKILRGSGLTAVAALDNGARISVAALQYGNNIFWRVHPKGRSFDVGGGTSKVDWAETGMSDALTQTSTGYSCFANPAHLWLYVMEMGWETDAVDVIGFTGAITGEGWDGEPTVTPDAQPFSRMSWDKFESELDRTSGLSGSPWSHGTATWTKGFTIGAALDNVSVHVASDYVLKYDMQGVQAMVTPVGTMFVRPDVHALTVLHECAHIINRSTHGQGHDDAFIQVAADLYGRYISPAAKAKFLDLALPPTTAKTAAMQPSQAGWHERGIQLDLPGGPYEIIPAEGRDKWYLYVHDSPDVDGGMKYDIGYLYLRGNVVDDIHIDRGYQRQGLGTKLFEVVQSQVGTLQHSQPIDMTPAGLEWSKSVGRVPQPSEESGSTYNPMFASISGSDDEFVFHL